MRIKINVKIARLLMKSDILFKKYQDIVRESTKLRIDSKSSDARTVAGRQLRKLRLDRAAAYTEYHNCLTEIGEAMAEGLDWKYEDMEYFVQNHSGEKK